MLRPGLGSDGAALRAGPHLIITQHGGSPALQAGALAGGGKQHGQVIGQLTGGADGGAASVGHPIGGDADRHTQPADRIDFGRRCSSK